LLLPLKSESLELGKFVETIALDELEPSFIDIASRHASELLSMILNEGIKDTVHLIERLSEALHVHLQDCNCQRWV
jgi:hypothetical protein